MTNQITVSSSPATTTTTTRHPRRTLTPAKKSASNVGEVAGNTCVACCCCPCVLFECLILAVYKVPANVVRRIKKKKKMNGKDLQICGAHPSQQLVDELSDVDWGEFETVKVSVDGSTEAVELDKLMWDRFKDAGFWRTGSPKFN